MSVSRWRRLAMAVAAGVGATLTVFAVPAAAAGTPYITGTPYLKGGQTVPVYSYQNAVRESVWVQTPLDNDGDGIPDRVAVDIVRPREAADHHLRVPVILEGSPYYACCGRGNESELKE